MTHALPLAQASTKSAEWSCGTVSQSCCSFSLAQSLPSAYSAGERGLLSKTVAKKPGHACATILVATALLDELP